MSPTSAEAAPLILSAVLDAPVQQRLDALRRAHFPAERNHLDAHVTLFHHLPGAELDAVAAEIGAAVRRRSAPLVDVTGLRSLGRGVAVTLTSPELARFRADLARTWEPWLTAQDRTKRDLHVTVQNNVSPQEARALLAELATRVVPERTRAVALALWRYRGGPWEPVARFAFAGEEDAPGGGFPDGARVPGRDPRHAHREPIMTTPPATVLDAPDRSRFEINLDGRLAGFAQYRMKDPALIVFTHTEIDDAFEGQGLGSTLVRAALDAARTRGLAVRQIGRAHV